VRGRFSRELSLPVPDAPSRTKILKLMTCRMKLGHDVDLSEKMSCVALSLILLYHVVCVCVCVCVYVSLDD
jgi:ATP-dependent 26S proteasome regulatory subunit